MLEPIHTIIWLAVATASISFTLTKTPMFGWVKNWFGRLEAQPDAPSLWHQLWECPYCMSHWVAFFFIIVFHPMPFTGTWIDLLPAAFIVVTGSAIIVQLMILISHALSLLKRLLG